jgi:putative hydrolase of the HAD superfamily
MLPALAHVENWIFDLDNCLYPASTNLFELIDHRMTDYVQQRFGLRRDARARCRSATFTNMAPPVRPDDGQRDRPARIPRFRARHRPRPHLRRSRPGGADRPAAGRKFVFTNGDESYARRVLDRIGLANLWDGLHDIHAMDYVPKPDPRSYERLCARHGIDPARALFAEDMVRNLAPAKALGMVTLGRQWLGAGRPRDGPGLRRLPHARYRRLAAPGHGGSMSAHLQTVIDQAWDERDGIGPDTRGEVRQAVDAALAALDSGQARVAERARTGWQVNQWLKKAVSCRFA